MATPAILLFAADGAVKNKLVRRGKVSKTEFSCLISTVDTLESTPRDCYILRRGKTSSINYIQYILY